MKIDSKMRVYVTIATVVIPLCGCSYGGTYKSKGMLLDEEAISAPHGLIRLQERPVFPVDKNKRPYAVLEDSEDKPRITSKPFTIQEPEAK